MGICPGAAAPIASLRSLPRRTNSPPDCLLLLLVRFPNRKEKRPLKCGLTMERVMGIEPTRPAWKAGILAIELHPHKNRNYNNTDCLISQVFYKFFKKKAVQQPAQP